MWEIRSRIINCVARLSDLEKDNDLKLNNIEKSYIIGAISSLNSSLSILNDLEIITISKNNKKMLTESIATILENIDSIYSPSLIEEYDYDLETITMTINSLSSFVNTSLTTIRGSLDIFSDDHNLDSIHKKISMTLNKAIQAADEAEKARKDTENSMKIAAQAAKDTKVISGNTAIYQAYSDSSKQEKTREIIYEIIVFVLFVALILFTAGSYYNWNWISPELTDPPQPTIWLSDLLKRLSIIATLIFALSYSIYQVNKSKKAVRHYKQLEIQLALIRSYTNYIDLQKDEAQKQFLRDIGHNYFKGLPPLDFEKDTMQGIPLKDCFEICNKLTKK